MSEKLVPLFNPLSSSFSYDWRDDSNITHTLVMDPISVSYFTLPQAEFMIKHLTDEIMNRRKLNGINHKGQIEEIIKQIRVII